MESWIVFLVIGLTAMPAYGDSDIAAPVQSAEAGGSLQEIVVTARRREESLQEVPESVTAFTAANLD